MNLEAIRDALAAKVKAYITDAEFEVDGYPGLRMAPVIAVTPGDDYIGYWESFSGAGYGRVSYEVSALVPNVSGEWDAAERVADRLLSVGSEHPNSIADAIMQTPRTLGGLVADMITRNGSITRTADGVVATVTVDCTAKKVGARA